MLRVLAQRLAAPLRRPANERRLEALVRAGRVTLGRHTYGTPKVITFRGDATCLRIGQFVSIGHEVEFLLGGNHRVDWVTTFPVRRIFGLPGAGSDGHPASKGDIIVGNDVWLGYGCRVLSGVSIGDGAVIGAFTTVTRSVRPYSVVVGSPAREVRRRFSDPQIAALQKVAWWNWSDSKIKEEASALCSTGIDDFIRRHQDAAT